MKKKRSGFTLVELLAVIVILAIIMIIAIPSVMTALNNARKQTFFEYAQNIRQKAEQQYIQDLDLNVERTDCYVYDIKTDLGLGDTGSFDGWVKVKREATSSGARTALFSIKASSVIQAVKTCVTDEKSTCKPNEAYFVPEDSKSVDVTKSIKSGEKVCVSYQIGNSTTGSLETKDMGCKTYSQASEVLDTYEYVVEVTLTNKQYSVQDVVFTEDMSQEAFYNEIDKFNEAHKGQANALAITAPTCSSNSGVEDKGTTTLATTKVGASTTTAKGTSQVATSSGNIVGTSQVATSSGAVAGTSQVATSSGAVVETSQVAESTTTIPGSSQVASTETTTVSDIVIETSTFPTRDTTYAETTTIDTQDTSLLLSNLSVSGYDIGFKPLVFYYNLAVPYEVENLSVSATPSVTDGTVSVQISGQENLAVGLNVIVTEVFNTTTGKRSYYRINVRRYSSTDTGLPTGTVDSFTQTTTRADGLPDPTLEESDASLSQLSVSGFPSLNFDPNVYTYTLETNGVDAIYPYYKTSAKGAIVTVSGNTDLTDGSQVLLTVKSPNGFYTKTYTIEIKENKEASTTTKVIRGIAIGLAALLIAILIIYAITKNNRKSIRDDDDLTDKVKQASESIVTPTPMNGIQSNDPNGVQNVFQANDQANQNVVPQTPTDNDNNTGGTP